MQTRTPFASRALGSFDSLRQLEAQLGAVLQSQGVDSLRRSVPVVHNEFSCTSNARKGKRFDLDYRASSAAICSRLARTVLLSPRVTAHPGGIKTCSLESRSEALQALAARAARLTMERCG